MITAQRDPIPVIKWPHTITENTFSEEYIEIINKAFSNWERIKDPWAQEDCIGYSGIYWSPDCSTWKEEVKDLFKRSKYAPIYNKSSKDYLVVLELSVMRPNSDYRYHVDVSRKQCTGVCYWSKGKDGTLVKSGDNIIHVNYKFNRAFWFCNVTGEMWTNDRRSKSDPNIPWHTYFNHTDQPRYTVNINYTPQKEVHKFILEKWPQFEGFYRNDLKPHWRPLASGSVKVKK